MSDKIKAFCALCLVVIAVGVGSIAIDLHNQNIEDAKVNSTPATIQPTKDEDVRFRGVVMSVLPANVSSRTGGVNVMLETYYNATNETEIDQTLIANFKGINGSRSYDYTERISNGFKFPMGKSYVKEGRIWLPKDKLLEGFTVCNNGEKKTFKFDSPLEAKFKEGTYCFVVNKTTNNLTFTEYYIENLYLYYKNNPE